MTEAVAADFLLTSRGARLSAPIGWPNEHGVACGTRFVQEPVTDEQRSKGGQRESDGCPRLCPLNSTNSCSPRETYAPLI